MYAVKTSDYQTYDRRRKKVAKRSAEEYRKSACRKDVTDKSQPEGELALLFYRSDLLVDNVKVGRLHTYTAREGVIALKA